MGNGSQAEQQDVRAGKNYDPNRPVELHSAVLWQEEAQPSRLDDPQIRRKGMK